MDFSKFKDESLLQNRRGERVKAKFLSNFFKGGHSKIKKNFLPWHWNPLPNGAAPQSIFSL